MKGFNFKNTLYIQLKKFLINQLFQLGQYKKQ